MERAVATLRDSSFGLWLMLIESPFMLSLMPWPSLPAMMRHFLLSLVWGGNACAFLLISRR